MPILARITQRLGSLSRRLVLALLVPGMFWAGPVDEYEVKAAFLYNFTKFIEWPKNDLEAFNICILGDDPFGSSLDEFVKGKVASGKALQIRRLKEAAEAKQCQIVYVRADERNKATQLIDAVRKTPVLTVGEQSNFGKIGGMVYMTMLDRHVGFGINAAVADAAGLRVSAKLLSLAKSFKDGQK